MEMSAAIIVGGFRKCYGSAWISYIPGVNPPERQ
jgi:hypothetical protein